MGRMEVLLCSWVRETPTSKFLASMNLMPSGTWPLVSLYIRLVIVGSCLRTRYVFLDDFLYFLTFLSMVFDVFLMIIWRFFDGFWCLFDDFLDDVFDDFLMIFWCFLMIFWRFLMIFWRFFDDFWRFYDNFWWLLVSLYIRLVIVGSCSRTRYDFLGDFLGDFLMVFDDFLMIF